MAYKERDVTERELRTAMQQVVQHAHAPQGSHLRLSKEDLMRQIDVLEKAWRDVEWTVYYKETQCIQQKTARKSYVVRTVIRSSMGI
jgi:hypothetical protein